MVGLRGKGVKDRQAAEDGAAGIAEPHGPEPHIQRPPQNSLQDLQANYVVNSVFLPAWTHGGSEMGPGDMESQNSGKQERSRLEVRGQEKVVGGQE